jgi:hypothetical protein
MTELRPDRQLMTDSNVRVVTVEQAIRDARDVLDDYERRYGVASERLGDAFTDASGRIHETGAYLQWRATLERWRALTVAAPPV